MWNLVLNKWDKTTPLDSVSDQDLDPWDEDYNWATIYFLSQRFSLKLWHIFPHSRLRCVQQKEKKNDTENLRMLLIPKNCSNPEHYYLGSWKEDSNLSSFFAQIWAPVFLMSQGRTEHSPMTDQTCRRWDWMQSWGPHRLHLFGDAGCWFSTLFSRGEPPSW